MRFRLSSTLQRLAFSSKTHTFENAVQSAETFENGAKRKRISLDGASELLRIKLSGCLLICIILLFIYLLFES